MIRPVRISRRRLPLRHPLVVSILLLAAANAYGAVADDVRGLHEKGRAQEAYELGTRNQDRFGDPAFDLAFGMAAIDAGHAGPGVLALERYLLAYPTSTNARLELGRGYYLLGEYDRSREVFNEVLQRNPPPEVRRKIDQFLVAVSERESLFRTTTRGFFEAGVGRDSNVNSGVDSGIVNVPIFGPVQIASEGVKIADNFATLAGGFQVTRPVGRGMALFAGLSADGRFHRDADAFDQASANLVVGASWLRGDSMFRASLAGNTFYVDNDRYRNVYAATGEWHGKLNASNTVSLFAQGAELRYAGDNKVRDSRLVVLGAGLHTALSVGWQSAASITAHIGREANRRDRDDLGRDLAGVRVALTCAPRERWSAGLSATWQESRYLEDDFLFGTRRRDRYTALEGSVGYAFTPALSLRLEAAWIDNRSNIELYKYDRTVGALKLRYDYK